MSQSTVYEKSVSFPVHWLAGPLAVLVALGAAPAVSAQPGGALFPEPFVVEHHLVQTETDGSRFESEPVTDYYGGSWIVSVRPDGSRLVVDLVRRELTEIRPDKGVFWTVTFDRLGNLADRLARAERRAPEPETPSDGGIEAKSSAASDEPAELVVEELGSDGAVAGKAGALSEGDDSGVRRLRVVARDRADRQDEGMEVWVDPSVRLRPRALEALESFESVVGKPRGPNADQERPTVGRYVAAARTHASGAMTVRTARTLGADGPRSARVRLEDVTTRLERIDDFPEELVAVPDGLRRVPHPLEGMVTFLEAENERDRALSGRAEGVGADGPEERR